MEYASKIPFIVASVVGYLALGPVNFLFSLILAIALFTILDKLPFRFNAWYVVISTLALGIIIYYFYSITWIPYSFFLFLTLFDWALSPALLPLAVLVSVNGIVTSPLLGGYPVSVRLGGASLEATLLPLPIAYLIEGLPALVGYSLPSLLAFIINYVSKWLPNQLMIKLSNPLFVVIGSGILLNIARVKLRNIVKIKKKVS
ncbi:hypothetical protein IPA_00150 [Ignicoccus pacificus DSM 13166]|uniref:Uncharacterized protein n=1 Tax=Ignicoccus pacificus DSM 13166 TaxID=940294 RepID=A0A977KAA7_9CREN|nr:hypothetical protein IPA_00150 [Ignicoccus pacificus DSM 13166]